MSALIAFLRAVNIGGTGKMPMADLRSLAEAAGFDAVRTYIQSGNLVFSTKLSPAEAKTVLEAKLEGYAGKPVDVVIRTAGELAEVREANPFKDAHPSKLGILFLGNPPSPEVLRSVKGQFDEEIALGAREIYIHFPSGMGRSKLHLSAMSEGTMRNLNTVSKVVALAAEN